MRIAKPMLLITTPIGVIRRDLRGVPTGRRPGDPAGGADVLDRGRLRLTGLHHPSRGDEEKLRLAAKQALTANASEQS